ncbi:Polypeptide N-Acetylgalactosaminyltransferase 6 [Manis pentadactyla]|nr:Polypeptide N-Acetylgalactosaminyltransferase 6 [Manis pentadactyla]
MALRPQLQDGGSRKPGSVQPSENYLQHHGNPRARGGEGHCFSKSTQSPSSQRNKGQSSPPHICMESSPFQGPHRQDALGPTGKPFILHPKLPSATISRVAGQCHLLSVCLSTVNTCNTPCPLC